MAKYGPMLTKRLCLAKIMLVQVTNSKSKGCGSLLQSKRSE